MMMPHSGPENKKVQAKKNLVKSNNSISIIFFDLIPFFAMSKMAKYQVLNLEKVKMQFNEKKNFFLI